MNDKKLLPCPFCGGEAFFATEGGNWIACKLCGAETDYFERAKEAINAWNTRKPMERIVERLEQQAEQYHRREKEHEDKNITVQISKKYFGKACSYEHAIDIVKEEGGLNG